MRAVQSYFTEMYSGSEAGSCLRLIDFVYHSTLGLRVIKEKKKSGKVDGFTRHARVINLRKVGDTNRLLALLPGSEMCSGSEAGSSLRLIDFVYHSTLGLRVIKKKKIIVEPEGHCIPLAM